MRKITLYRYTKGTVGHRIVLKSGAQNGTFMTGYQLQKWTTGAYLAAKRSSQQVKGFDRNFGDDSPSRL
jgi:hypothetical protein